MRSRRSARPSRRFGCSFGRTRSAGSRRAAPLTAIGDEARFRQVLEQLLENESKYAPTDEGVSIGAWRLGDEIQVYVTDDGPGVPIEDWESVFEPFVRINGRGRSRGSGIGLFAARRLMDAMGGRVFLEPNGYGGSRFVVALPAGLAALAASSGPTPPRGSAPLAGARSPA